MSTKHVTTNQSSQQQQNVYDPQSMAAYHLNSGMMNQRMRGIMQNPFNNPFYNQTLRQGMGQANRVGATSMQNMIQGMQQRGIASGSPAAAYLTALQGRQNSALQANAFNNAQNQAYGMWGAAANYLGNFRPLQTGSNQQGNSTTTEKTSGLGTWLPQVAGAALGGLGGMATGGMLGGGFFGKMMGNAFGGGAPQVGAMNPFSYSNTGGYVPQSMTAAGQLGGDLFPGYSAPNSFGAASFIGQVPYTS